MAPKYSISFLILFSLSRVLTGQTSSPPDLGNATLEELMRMEVTSAAKHSQSVADTAASVYVITAEDIRRSGISVLPELFRLAPGVQVARISAGNWAVSIRGFNQEFADKILVLIDGLSIYNEFFSGVQWDAADVPLDSIERIEIIRGPAAALWGSNAVNGVINVITKNAKSTQGGELSAEGGSSGEHGSSARFGGQAGQNFFYRVGVRETGASAYDYIGPVIPTPTKGWGTTRLDLRLDWKPTSRDTIMVSGSGYHSTVGQLLPGIDPFAPLLDGPSTADGSNLIVDWQHTLSETQSFTLRASVDQLRRQDPQIETRDIARNYGLEYHWRPTGQDIVIGTKWRDLDFHILPTQILNVSKTDVIRDELAFFAEDQISLVPNHVSLTLAVQESRNRDTGWEIQPTARLLWSPNKNLSTWVALSRAVRTPNIADRELDYTSAAVSIPLSAVNPAAPAGAQILLVPEYLGTPNFRSEAAIAYEAGQRVQATRHLSFDLSAYYTIYQHLAGSSTGVPSFALSPSGQPYLKLPIVGINGMSGVSLGTELSTNWTVNDRWRLIGGFSWMRLDTDPYPGTNILDTDVVAGGNPRHQWQLRSNFDLTSKWQLDTALYYTGAMNEIGIPSHLRGDLRIGWRPDRHLEVSAGVQDAFQARHIEAYSTRILSIAEVPRNIYLKATWRF